MNKYPHYADDGSEPGRPKWYRHDEPGFKIASVGREIPFQEPKDPNEPHYTIGKINSVYIPDKNLPWDINGPYGPLDPWPNPLPPAPEKSDILKKAEEMLKKYQKDHDPVNHPQHYNLNEHGIECIQAIEASMSKEGFKGYLKGNVMKYLWRYEYKGKALEDLEKAAWYLNKLKGKL